MDKNTFLEYMQPFDQLEGLLNSAFKKIHAYVLSTKYSQRGRVGFKFPANYAVYFNQLSAVSTPPMSLAAHTLYPGALIEGVGDEHKYGKGGLIYHAVKDRLPDWSDKEATYFQKNLQRYISSIGKDIGLLFETMTFKALRDGYHLTPVETEVDVDQAQETILSNIQTRIRNKAFIIKLKHLVLVHANDMSRDILAVARRIMPYCNIDQVIFQGGEGAATFLTSRQDPADIVVGCSTIRQNRLTTPTTATPVQETELFTWLKDFFTQGKNKSLSKQELYLMAFNELLEDRKKNPEQQAKEDEVPF